MVYTNCCMVYTIQKWYIPWGNLPDGDLSCPASPWRAGQDCHGCNGPVEEERSIRMRRRRLAMEIFCLHEEIGRMRQENVDIEKTMLKMEKKDEHGSLLDDKLDR